MRNSLNTLNQISIGTAVDKALRKCILRLHANNTCIAVRCNKQRARLKVRKRTTDAEVVWQCFSARQYEIPVVIGAAPLHHDAVQEKYLDIIRTGKTPLIVDCGANIGASSAWFKMRYPEATIVAVEPAPDNYAALVDNCSQFQSIDPIEAGIGPKDTKAFLQDNGGGAWGYQTTNVATGQQINMISVKTILDAKSATNHTPFLIKIDIEGAEKDLFETDSYLTLNSFPLIIFEAHDFYMPAQRTASSFFRFHSDTGRDFLFGMENVFSIDMNSVLNLAKS